MMAMYILFQGEVGLVGAPGMPGLTGSKVKKPNQPVSFYVFSFSTSFLLAIQYVHKSYLNYIFTF